MISLALRNLSKSYGSGSLSTRAVEDLDLSVSDGEFLVVVGPSGCGKTTTLRLIAGLEEPTTGTVLIAGQDMTGVAPRHRDAALVFQDLALYPAMTVFQNLAFALQMRKTPRAEITARVREAAVILGIEHLLERRPESLSGGETQRVALGRVIVRRPALLLLDEPLSNLDPQLRNQLRVEIKSLQRRLGITTVFVTHDQEEAMTLGDRIAVLRNGVLQQCGPPEEVYDQPANQFVAGFIGSPPMNFIDATIDGGSDGVRRVTCVLGTAELAPRSNAGSVSGAHPSMRVILGVRPEDVIVRPDNSPGVASDRGEMSVPGGIGLVEPLGGAANLHVCLPDQSRWIARTLARPLPAIGHTVRITIPTGRTHLFESSGPQRRLAF